MKKIFSTLIVSVILLALIPFDSFAQFISSGDDPARLHWKQKTWPDYRVVYPEGLDSLANIYGNLLEKYRVPVSRSTGLLAGGGYRRPTPVVLHAYNGVSNAMVAWAPKRMEFYTLGMPYETEALSWEKNLAIHEGRHLSQMMLGYNGWFRSLRYLTGDMIPVAVTGLYTPSFLLEGDAVVAETALTDLGRGRDGDFLNYYHSAFDTGNLRNWTAWKYGSWRHYAPDYYALGYLTIAGTRVFYDDPLFMDNIFSRISRMPLRFNSVRKEIRLASGMKFRPAWDGIVEGFHQMWEESAQERGPFIRSEFATDVPKWYENYAHGTFVRDSYYTVRSGLVHPSTLSRVDHDGSVTDIRPFASSVSDLYYDPVLDRIYWSETFTDPRWGHQASSRIRYFSLEGKDPDSRKSYKPQTLTKKGRLCNPSVSNDGKRIAVVDYKYTGGTDHVILDALTGKELRRVSAPSGLQLTLSSWLGDDVAVVGLSDDGMGVYKVADGRFEELVAPVKAKLGGLGNTDAGLVFTSDRTGVNETYEWRDGEVFQRTATRYGAGDGLFEGDTLYFVTQETGIQLYHKNGNPRGRKHYGEGSLVHKAAVSDLIDRKVDFQAVSGDKVADAISRQEIAISRQGTAQSGGAMDLDRGTMDLARWAEDAGSDWKDMDPQAKTYHKLPHIPRFHSWAPLKVEYDNYSELNFDELLQAGGVGATAWFQNDLGTASGYVAYGYNLFPIRKDGVWFNRHSGHFNMTYTGLYPVIELEAHVGDRPAYNITRETSFLREYFAVNTVTGHESDRPSFNSSLSVYLPLRFNSNGWLRGVTPRVSYFFSNDLYRPESAYFDYGNSLVGAFPSHSDFVGIADTKAVFMQSVSASVSGYIVQPTPASLVYPRKGIGLQMGYHQRIGLTDVYSAGFYSYLYGYLPGFARTHGLKLTATMQHTLWAPFIENIVSMSPRGLSEDPDFSRVLSGTDGTQLKYTADYAIQFGLPEKQRISDIFHFTHMSLIPHADLLLFPYEPSGTDVILPEMLYSVGTSITAHSANFLWFPAGFQIGISLDYNGGPSFNRLTRDGFELSRFHAGLILNIDI